ncbi:MAG TPA: ABC transporter permease [Aggregatilineales bacterium]|nr:ABC transporter permease [Anaerolineae bacterium]HUN05971.1 ABC transporter permease [Aggregatilineales bacterium]
MTTAAPTVGGRTRLSQSQSLVSRLVGFATSQEVVLLLVVVLLFTVVGNANPRFLAERNVLNIFNGNAYIAVAAVGMTMVIISRNIDISVGSLIGVLGTISGAMAVNGYPIWSSWLVPILLGGLVGAVIGFMVAYLRIPSIVVTLGLLSILKGGLITVTNGEWITDMPADYFLAQMRTPELSLPGITIPAIPSPIIIMVILTLLAALWMRYSATGRAIYAVGGNAEAARLSGISEKRIIMTVFIINGLCVGIAAVLWATQLSIIQSTVPAGLELQVITSAVVGGVSILGGIGTTVGAMLAAILLSAINSALVFINVSPYWFRSVVGVLILITVLTDMLRRRRTQI